MRWRVYFFVSLVLNLLLAAGWLWSVRIDQLRNSRVALGFDTNASVQIRTNVLVRRQFFSWAEVESDDYPTYVTHLRDINCPEQTIRDIIIADVNALYARKRALEIVTPEQQWWRPEPDTNVVQLATARARELDQERRELLTQLLGGNWESGDLVSLPRPSRPPVALDGPVLGMMPNDIKQRVEEISLRTQERIQTYVEEQRQAGKSPDPVELAKLRQQTRVELASVLSPFQLEEYLLRYSQNAGALRTELGQLKFFEATSDEFRAVFRATDNFDQQLELLAGATDVNSAAARRSLEDQRLAALKNALGADRFDQYQMLHDQKYRDAYAAAQEAGTPESVSTLYQINQAVAQESSRIRGDTNLTTELRAIELKKLELDQLRAVARAVGQEPLPEPPMPPKPTPAKTHVLLPGEGVGFLARHYGVDADALRAANPNLNFDRLRPGDSVKIPINLLPPTPVPALVR